MEDTSPVPTGSQTAEEVSSTRKVEIDAGGVRVAMEGPDAKAFDAWTLWKNVSESVSVRELAAGGMGFAAERAEFGIGGDDLPSQFG